MQKHRFNFLFAACFGAAITFLSWLLISPSSPASQSLREFIGLAQIAPIYLANLLTGSTHEPWTGRIFVIWLFAFVQWFIAGYFLGVITHTTGSFEVVVYLTSIASLLVTVGTSLVIIPNLHHGVYWAMGLILEWVVVCHMIVLLLAIGVPSLVLVIRHRFRLSRGATRLLVIAIIGALIEVFLFCFLFSASSAVGSRERTTEAFWGEFVAEPAEVADVFLFGGTAKIFELDKRGEFCDAKAEREAVETAGLGDNRSITGLKPRC